MTHYRVQPHLCCGGRLVCEGHWLDTSGRHANDLNGTVVARYVCDECAAIVNLRRKQIDPPEGQIVPLVELAWTL